MLIHYNKGFQLSETIQLLNFGPILSPTVRSRDTRPQAARTSQVHVFELDPKKFEMNEFM